MRRRSTYEKYTFVDSELFSISIPRYRSSRKITARGNFSSRKSSGRRRGRRRRKRRLFGKGGRKKGKKRREKKACDQGGKGSSVPFGAYLLFVIIYKVVILRIATKIDFYVDEFMRVPDGGRRVAVVRP